MALNAKKAGGAASTRVEQDNLDPGSYPARLVQIIDLGLQPQRPYQGKDKPPMPEIMLAYELVDVFMKDEDGKELEDKPRWISETIPFHNLRAEKAKSTIRYYSFDPNEEFEGDFTKLIGMPITVTVINNKVGEKVYDNVGTTSAMRAKDAAKCPDLVNPAKVFTLDEPDMDIFNTLPGWLQDKIKGNLEYEGSALQKLTGNNKPTAKAPPKEVKNEKPADKDEDDNEDAPY